MLKFIARYKLYIFLVLLVLILVAGYLVSRQSPQKTAESGSSSAYLRPDLTPETTQTTDEPTQNTLPDKFLIKNFPFQTQAPFANWDALHEEACEEASVILAAFYLLGKDLSTELMEQEIQKLVQWENENFNGVVDINVEQAGQLAKANYGLGYKVIKNSNIAELKKQIAAGNPVVIPAAGRLLGNPNFRGEGPVYHMVVAIGYDEDTIIVQDVGTRNGNHYEYNHMIFYNAWHDWAGAPENILTGAKNMLILTK